MNAAKGLGRGFKDTAWVCFCLHISAKETLQLSRCNFINRSRLRYDIHSLSGPSYEQPGPRLKARPVFLAIDRRKRSFILNPGGLETAGRQRKNKRAKPG